MSFMSNFQDKTQFFSLLSTSQQFTDAIQILVITPSHQAQFSKNYDLVYEKYKRNLTHLLSLEELKRCYCNSSKKIDGRHTLHHLDSNEIYIFLSLLSIYEKEIQKRYTSFKNEDWEFFAHNIIFSDAEKAKTLSQTIFKRNRINFEWTKEEDKFLLNLLNKSPIGKRVRWTHIAVAFNKQQNISQFRSAPQLKQRWEHKLKTNYKIGKWEKNEDLTILKFVWSNGPKWSILAKKFISNRTQHAVKNRFFSLMSAYTSIPIRKIKKEIEYLNKYLIHEALVFHQNCVEKVKFYEKTDGLSSNETMEFFNDERPNSLNECISKENDDTLQFFSRYNDFIPLY